MRLGDGVKRLCGCCKTNLEAAKVWTSKFVLDSRWVCRNLNLVGYCLAFL